MVAAGTDFPPRQATSLGTRARFRLHATCLAMGLNLAAAPFSHAALPGFPQVKAGWRAADTLLLDQHGELLQEVHADPKQRHADWVPLADTSPALIAAVLRAEDRRFFRHEGVDWLAAAKAALTNWLNDRPRGASTLSMQLAALLDPRYRAHGSRRDVPEKLRQMEAGQELEQAWSKAEILEAYLNLLPLRAGLTGIDAGARGLFGKRPAALSHGEALILAALIRSPNAKPKDVVRRACDLARHTKGAPSCARLKRLTLASLGRVPALPAANLAPQLLARLKTQPGEKRRTSLDAGLQRFVADALETQLRRLPGRDARLGAALVLDNASGRVLAYVSASSATPAPTGDGVQTPRPAGPTLQPFLYALALDQGLLTAASPLEVHAPDSATAQPHAPSPQDLVSLRQALAGSRDLPARHALQLVGPEALSGSLAQLGFTGLAWSASPHGETPGSLEVRLGELTNAYRALANEGRHAPLGFKADAASTPSQYVYSRESAWLVGDILADRQSRPRAPGQDVLPAARYWAAMKAGASPDQRDHWCLGYTQHYTVGVRIGSLGNRPPRTSSASAAPVWAAIMDRLHAGLPSTQPKPPEGLVRKAFLAEGEAPRQEWFLSGTEPEDPPQHVTPPPAPIPQPGNGAAQAPDSNLPAEQ